MKTKSGLISLLLATIALIALGFALASPAKEWRTIEDQYVSLEQDWELEQMSLVGTTTSDTPQRLHDLGTKRSEVQLRIENLAAGSIAAIFFAIVLGVAGLRQPRKALAIMGMVGAVGAAGLLLVLLDAVPSMF